VRTTRSLDAAAVAAALPWPVAIAALVAAFETEDPDGPARAHLDVPDGELLLMPAHGAAGVGVKLVTIAPGNPARGLPLIHGTYVLFAPGSLAPEAVLDGTALTIVRTAAVSALATDRLARLDASRLTVFGAGVQARAHALAMASVRPIASVTVVGRDPERAAALVADLRAAGLDAATAGPEAVADADLVCTCTTSADPVFDGAALAPGTHVNAIGAYRRDLRELDDTALSRAALVAVETRTSALAEAGDIVHAVAAGALDADDLVELRDVVTGAAGRSGREDITVFKSVGVALEDLAVARAAVGWCRES
jgi:ornithine cyclodeaminase/alanine dehydrogenase-like protein (mu-crystallin family)